MGKSMQTALQMLQINIEQNWIEANKEQLTKDQKKLVSSILSAYFLVHILEIDDLLLSDAKEHIEEWSEIKKLEEVILTTGGKGDNL